MAKKAVKKPTTPLTKSGLIKIVSENSEMASKAATKRVVDKVFDVMTDALKSGQSVQISGFGTVEVYTRKKRKYMNPQTKKMESFPAHKAVHFKACKALRDTVN